MEFDLSDEELIATKEMNETLDNSGKIRALIINYSKNKKEKKELLKYFNKLVGEIVS